MTFHGNFCCALSVGKEFSNYYPNTNHDEFERISNEYILFATYDKESYEGYAYVLIARNEGGKQKLFDVDVSHCSCNGLEGSWDPRPTTLAAIEMRMEKGDHYGMSDLAKEKLKGVIQDLRGRKEKTPWTWGEI